jgi:hypothetical protein
MTSKFYAAILLSTCLGGSACGKPAVATARPDSPAPCGDTAAAASAACDDGSVVSGKPPICGDGFVDKKDEDCDDGNTVLESCPAGQPECKVCGPVCTLVAGTVTLNRAPTIDLHLSAAAGLLPGQSAAVTAAVNDADGDALDILWTVKSATAAGIDCYAELVTMSAGTRLFLALPLRPADVRCADAMIVSATVSDAAASASASVTLTVAAPPLLGVAWSELAGNPVVPLSTCPAWDCLTHSDPAIGRDESGALVLWFSAGGDRGNHPVIGRAVQQPGGAFAFSPTEPVMEFDAAGVAPDPLPWDYVRETVSVLWNPAASRWNMAYLGYKTDYYTDPAIGLVESLDSAGTLWPRAPAPIYTPVRPDGWDAAFLTSPMGLLGSDGVWRIYFAGSVRSRAARSAFSRVPTALPGRPRRTTRSSRACRAPGMNRSSTPTFRSSGAGT